MSDHQLHEARRYRRQAKQIREVAQWISLLDVKQHLLETARHLEALADSEEREAHKVTPIATPKPEP